MNVPIPNEKGEFFIKVAGHVKNVRDLSYDDLHQRIFTYRPWNQEFPLEVRVGMEGLPWVSPEQQISFPPLIREDVVDPALLAKGEDYHLHDLPNLLLRSRNYGLGSSFGSSLGSSLGSYLC